MKKLYFRVCDCEHEGDVEGGASVVSDALKKIRSNGKILRTEWSGEDGDDAFVYFEVEAEKVDAMCAAVRELI